jgi:hypothetical protein
VDQLPVRRWEWRTFAGAFDELTPLMPAAYEIAHETYVLGAAAHANVKIRGNAVDVKTLLDTRHGLELWQQSLQCAFPLCHRAVREIYAALEVHPPESLFLPEYNQCDFLTDLVCCTDGVRIVGMNKVRRHAIVEGCIVERSAACVAGQTIQSAAVESADPDGLRRLLTELHLDRFENVNYPEFLKRQLGVRSAAPAVSTVEGAHHDARLRNDSRCHA